jgi:hypothetical protein
MGLLLLAVFREAEQTELRIVSIPNVKLNMKTVVSDVKDIF